MQISSVAPGYTVDSITTVAPFAKCGPRLAQAASKRAEIRLARGIDGRGHGNDDDARVAKDRAGRW